MEQEEETGGIDESYEIARESLGLIPPVQKRMLVRRMLVRRMISTMKVTRMDQIQTRAK